MISCDLIRPTQMVSLSINSESLISNRNDICKISFIMYYPTIWVNITSYSQTLGLGQEMRVGGAFYDSFYHKDFRIYAKARTVCIGRSPPMQFLSTLLEMTNIDDRPDLLTTVQT